MRLACINGFVVKYLTCLKVTDFNYSPPLDT